MSLNTEIKELFIAIKATHFNFVNENNLYYTSNAVSKGVKSWTYPYNKPQLLMHDTKRDPVGRIFDYSISKEPNTKHNEPEDYVELIAKITDKDSIDKILDGRYLTVSVGSSSNRVICSECGQCFNEDGICSHKKGTYNEDGKLIYWIIDQINYSENSFVNEPADPYAKIYKIKINNAWYDYNDFINGKLTDSLNKKENIMDITKLPDSYFCGPNKTFVAQDIENIESNLNIVKDSKLSESLKNKLLASLYRKAKKFDDEYDTDGFDLTYRMEDSFTDEEVSEVDEFVKTLEDQNNNDNNTDVKSPKFSIVDSKNQDENLNELQPDELIKVITDARAEIKKITDESNKAISSRDSKISKLEKEINDQKTEIYDLEDRLEKYVNKTILFDKKYKDSVISNILDLKLTDSNNETKEDLLTRYESRSIDSLEDTLKDLRFPKLKDNSESNGDNNKVTLKDGQKNSKLDNENKEESYKDSKNEEDDIESFFSFDKTENTEAE